MTALAKPLPLAAISHLLGLPEDQQPVFERLAAPLSQRLSGLNMLSMLWGLGGLVKDIERRIDAARAGDERLVLQDGLIAQLVKAEEAGERLDGDELVAMILTLLVAGHETTTHLISGGAWALLSHPDQRERMTAAEVSIEDAVEELLRWLSPVMQTKARYAARDGEIDGSPYARGERVTAFLLAANHDPARWPDPERLDLGRKPAGHLSFGAGIHFCLGLQLARLEAATALRRLFERFPTLRLAGEPVWTTRLGVRGFERLRLRAR